MEAPSHSIYFFHCFIGHRLSWDTVKLQAVHALTEGYLCVKYLSSLILSAICLSLRPFSPQQYCMLAGSDLAWGAIVLSLIKQWINASAVEGGLCGCWCVSLWLWTASSCGCLNPLVEKSEWGALWVTWERMTGNFLFRAVCGSNADSGL